MINPHLRPTTSGHIASMKGLLYFIHEREIIRRKKEAGLPQEEWTEDVILQEYRFCNVRRRDDLVSKWIIEHVFGNENFVDGEDEWLLAMFARLINWPPTIHYMMERYAIINQAEQFNAALFIRTLAKYKERMGKNGKVFTGAYMVFPAGKYLPKEEGIALTIQKAIVNKDEIRRALADNTCAGVAKVLEKGEGVGTFMAGQFVADLTYIPGQLDLATDLYTWAPLGPGSQRGMNYLMGFKPNKGWTSDQFCTNLADIGSQLFGELGWEDGIPPTLHDLQSCMCEYSKYSRTVLGDGRPRSTYTTNVGIF
jgi:hypothetical protein